MRELIQLIQLQRIMQKQVGVAMVVASLVVVRSVAEAVASEAVDKK